MQKIHYCRHILLLAAVRESISTHVGDWTIGSEKYLKDYLASKYENAAICCTLQLGVRNELGDIDYVPPSPKVSADVVETDAEIAELGKIKLVSSFFAALLLDYAKEYPQDVDIPKLLSLAINSNKYGVGCDYDNKGCNAVFRKCFDLLHKNMAKPNGRRMRLIGINFHSE